MALTAPMPTNTVHNTARICNALERMVFGTRPRHGFCKSKWRMLKHGFACACCNKLPTATWLWAIAGKSAAVAAAAASMKARSSEKPAVAHTHVTLDSCSGGTWGSLQAVPSQSWLKLHHTKLSGLVYSQPYLKLLAQV